MAKSQQSIIGGWALMALVSTSVGSLVGLGVALALVTTGSPVNTCPPPEQAKQPSLFPQPVVRRSLNGLLQTTLHGCTSTNQMLDQNQVPPVTVTFHPPTFEGTVTGPTLSVKPGDKLKINVVNNLPENPPNERGGAFPHNENSFNLHTHGLTVSPLGISDNIFREMEPNTTNQVEVDIPKDHPSGTYWYHVHKHGSATYQFLGGMVGFLIVEGGPGSLDTVREVAAAKDIPMAFSVIRSLNDGRVVFVYPQAQQFGTFPFPDPMKMPPVPANKQGVWSTYGLDGGPPLAPDGLTLGPPSRFSYMTNGVANPTLQMQPGEVQRWRLLNASDGDNLQLVVVSKDPQNPQKGLGLNVIAMDAITVPTTYHLQPGDPLVIGPGQRVDVLVKAGATGTYLLQTLDPNTGAVKASVSPYRDSKFPNGIDPAWRPSRHSFDFPSPCPGLGGLPCEAPTLNYPITLVTINVSGATKNMNLPRDPLPRPRGLPNMNQMVNKKPDKVRHVVFELCGGVPDFQKFVSLPSCAWYLTRYNAEYWGKTSFTTLQMMRDADDVGESTDTNNPFAPRINFKKEGLFDPTKPLFPDMIAGNYEEWTVYNHSFSDHPWHLHQNHVLVTKINETTLPQPEWHDTLIVPATRCGNPLTTCQGGGQDTPSPGGPDINHTTPGSITFRVYFNPITVGCFVAHCHILDHEDLGMMQRMDILPGPGESSGCAIPASQAFAPLRDRLASLSSSQICSSSAPPPLSYSPWIR